MSSSQRPAPETASSPPRGDRSLAWLVPALCFFLSGASSLVFEVIWTRKMTLVLGASTLSISTVLTVFMGGLALGSFVVGRIADRLKFPILTYAIMEVGVGVFALLVPWVVDHGYPPISRLITNHGGNSFDQFALLRFVVVAVVLLPPTTLMGATLPLLARHFVRQGGGLGQRVGALYAVNTFGAVAGTFLAGFKLLPALGLSTTNAIAGATNLTLAALILVFRKTLLGAAWPRSWRDLRPEPRAGATPAAASPETPSLEPAPAATPAAPRVNRKKRSGAPAPRPASTPIDAAEDLAAVLRASPQPREEDLIDEPHSRTVRYAALVVAAGSGFAALAYEVILSRALDMVIGSSIYSFTIILMAFLVGIGGGSGACSAILRARPSPRVAVIVGGAFFAVGLLQYVIYNTRLSLMLFLITTLVVLLCVAIALTWKRPALALGAVQLMIGLGAACTYYFQDKIPRMFVYLAMVATGSCDNNAPIRFSNHIPTIQWMSFVVAALCALPAAVGMGASFPLALRAYGRNLENVGGDTGAVYSVNTLGSIAGSFLTGFVVMPYAGMETAFYLAVAVNLTLALVLLLVAPGDEPAKYVLVPVTAILLAIAATGTVLGRDGRVSRSQSRFALFPQPWNQELMTMGVFRLSLADGMISRRNNQCRDDEVSDRERGLGGDNPIFYRDGITTTVTVERWSLGERTHFALKNNGKVDASNGDDMPTQVLVAGLPLLLHPRGPEGLNVALVGWGSGVTVGTALQFPIARLDVIELERATLEASRYFRGVNHLDFNLEGFPYVSMPRLNVINNDGRNYLSSTDRRYDVVISEPSNPWITGVSNLFTRDAFRAASQALAPGGIYLQWVQLYELSPNNIKTIYRTIAEVFPYVRVFAADAFSSDTIVLGSFSPIALDVGRVDRALAGFPRARAALEPAHITGAADLFARTLFASREEIRRFAVIDEHPERGAWVTDLRANGSTVCAAPDCRRHAAPINTDDNALIEFAAPRDLIGFDAYAGYTEALYQDDWPYGHVEDEVVGLGEGADRAAALANLGVSLLAGGRPARSGEVIDRAAGMRDPQGQLYRRPELERAAGIFTAMTTGREPALHLESPHPGPDLSDEGARTLREAFRHATESLSAGATRTALAEFATIPVAVRDGAGPSVRLLYAYMLYRASMEPDSEPRYGEAAEQLGRLFRDEPEWCQRHPEVMFFLGRSQYRAGDYLLAVNSIARFVDTARQPLLRDHELPDIVRDLEEPAEGTTPETDAPGESDKDHRAE